MTGFLKIYSAAKINQQTRNGWLVVDCSAFTPPVSKQNRSVTRGEGKIVIGKRVHIVAGGMQQQQLQRSDGSGWVRVRFCARCMSSRRRPYQQVAMTLPCPSYNCRLAARSLVLLASLSVALSMVVVVVVVVW